MSNSDVSLYSKSSVERDWRCPRSFYHAYKNLGGLQPASQQLELFLGTALHDGLAVIATQWKNDGEADINLICDTAFKQVCDPLMSVATDSNGTILEEKAAFAHEQATLIEGILYAFYKHMWPKLMDQYDIWMIEQAGVYRHGPGNNLGMVAKPDILLESKTDGSKFYVEYKSTSSKKIEWIKSWEYAIQLHSSIRAVEQATGEKVEYIIVQGLYKGDRRYDKQSSPYCYSYRKAGNPPFTEDTYSYEYKYGFTKYPTWEHKGGTRKWIDNMPETMLSEQFPQTPPIFINDDLIDAFYLQQESRQLEIITADALLNDDRNSEEYKQSVLDKTYPQRFDQCVPAWGYSCPYVQLCHGPKVDPLQVGFVQRDTTHLEPFLDILREQNAGRNL